MATSPNFSISTPALVTQNIPHLFAIIETLPWKLDRSNYLVWKSYALLVICSYGVEDHISNPNVVPSQFLEFEEALVAQNTPHPFAIIVTLSLKLDRTSYLVWKSPALLVICGYGAKDHISNLNVAPSQFLEFEKGGIKSIELNPAHDALKKQDHFILGWLRQLILLELCGYAINVESAYDLWNAL
ncbi:hypothetical protein FEM48_Zijuj01G0175200 [Ziziphus jujuba var. spinosa]|uniref:Uncharacterized protein n=1 Tax=Ziziphus jujuba var. spinosa TaxID=714518 RepID=A0A978W2L4_ZIZJJ|nr:hypothetical protein FEM48_Zijuj01G0175200 [Ziziphus jujuba var. spinosa]